MFGFGGIVTVRLINLAVLSMAAISAAVAGQIEIGATSLTNTALNTSTGISTGGLDAAYIGSNGWTTAGGGERAYSTTIFSSDTLTNSSLGGGTLPTAVSGFQQFTDPNNGIVFAMDADSGMNFWASNALTTTANSASSITIPVGVFDANSAYIMLQDYYALGNTDTVVFNFANFGK